MLIQPTVGRVVWFWPPHEAGGPKQQQPYAATVAYVHSDRCINVGYVDHNGNPGGASSVTLVQEGDVAPATGYYAEWMPYQKGQAARTDQVERKLADSAGVGSGG